MYLRKLDLNYQAKNKYLIFGNVANNKIVINQRKKKETLISKNHQKYKIYHMFNYF